MFKKNEEREKRKGLKINLTIDSFVSGVKMLRNRQYIHHANLFYNKIK